MTTTSTPVPTETPASLIWYTDRSRYNVGTRRCPRSRYLGYHAGPTGYGLTACQTALPLATGLGVHHGAEAFAAILRDHDRLPDLTETRQIVADTVTEYILRVEKRGYLGILGGPTTEETITEQSCLIGGLLWVVRLNFLPWLHQNYQVVSVEKERLHFLSCECGAPPLDAAEHMRRGCTGQALMLRNDLLARRRNASSLAYFEFKTTGWESDAWVEQWETDPQLAAGTVDVEALHGAEVTETYIVALSKGRRAKDRNETDGRKRQQSPLCYGYCRPANPPLAPDDWLPAYEWINANGETKRASRAHRRRGIWELEKSDWPTYNAYRTANPDMTPVEFWVRQLPASILDRICFTLGPMNRQDAQLGMLLRGIAGEETRWQHALWRLYDLQQDGYAWSSPVFQALLDELIPCSWNCRPFGKDHQCEFVPICHHHIGWDDPIGSGHYQPRLPHHEPELHQAVARGLLTADAAEAAEEE